MELIDNYKKWLRDINYPSCREIDGARIIKDLTGHDAEVLIDPTMMLNREQWRQIYEKVIIPERPYMLLYFLGDIPDERRKIIDQILKLYQLQAVDVLKDKASPYFSLQPDGLLQMIENATIICTDSFHVSAFSINFNVPFYVFDRRQKESFGNNMISRIDNLLNLCGLSQRLNPKNTTEALNCDFSKANSIIEFERNKEREFLLKCLKKC